MERWRGRVALVTGASAGIGYCVTKALVERGMKVVACARNIDTIQKLSDELQDQPGSLTAVKCDVSKQEDVSAMFHMIRHNTSLGRVDVCINNAGLLYLEPLLTGDPSKWKHMFDVNVLGVMMVTKEAFTLMKENNIDDGHIILVNSIAGVKVSPQSTFHSYSATKFALTAIREGLRNELRELKSNIRVTQVCPGVTETELLARAGRKDISDAVSSYLKCLKPEDVRNSILYALDAPPHVEINDIVLLPTDQPW